MLLNTCGSFNFTGVGVAILGLSSKMVTLIPNLVACFQTYCIWWISFSHSHALEFKGVILFQSTCDRDDIWFERRQQDKLHASLKEVHSLHNAGVGDLV